MTNEERQQVIQALERAANYISLQSLSGDIDEALAIMRRERKPVGVVRPDGNTFRLLAPLPAGTPIYKD
jgi:hypothetical protein